MELKINIYNELDEVVKEHKRNGYSIKMRTVKNVIETLDTKKIGIALNEEGSNAEAISVVGHSERIIDGHIHGNDRGRVREYKS